MIQLAGILPSANNIIILRFDSSSVPFIVSHCHFEFFIPFCCYYYFKKQFSGGYMSPIFYVRSSLTRNVINQMMCISDIKELQEMTNQYETLNISMQIPFFFSFFVATHMWHSAMGVEVKFFFLSNINLICLYI